MSIMSRNPTRRHYEIKTSRGSWKAEVPTAQGQVTCGFPDVAELQLTASFTMIMLPEIMRATLPKSGELWVTHHYFTRDREGGTIGNQSLKVDNYGPRPGVGNLCHA